MTATKTPRTRRSSSVQSMQAASRSRTRATAKTGDPQADRAARDAATKGITKPGTPEQQAASAAAVAEVLSTATHEYVLVNGDFRVHKAGCKDMAKELRNSDYAKPVGATWTTEEDAVRDLWGDIIGDNVDQAKDGPVPVSYLHEHGLVQATSFAPCCKLTAMPEPDGDRSAKADAKIATAKRDAKQALAKAVLDAVAELFADDAPVTKRFAADGMDDETAKRTVAQWLHHIHGGTTDGKRYWPASLPTPNRSDWR